MHAEAAIVLCSILFHGALVDATLSSLHIGVDVWPICFISVIHAKLAVVALAFGSG